MGANSKLNVQFVDRHWRTLGGNGDSYADAGYQATWEVTRAQSGTPGILVDYTGGRIGDSFGSGTPLSRAKTFVKQLEPVFPGISGKLNGRATIDYWPGNPYQRGSYSYWKVGQYQAFAGVGHERSGRCHFAGETPPTTSRATSMAPSKPDNAPLPRSWATTNNGRNPGTPCGWFTWQ